MPSTAADDAAAHAVERRSVARAPLLRLRTGKFPWRPLTDELLSLTFSAMPPLVVGVDFGTLSGRAVVVRVHDGAELAARSPPTRTPCSTGRCPTAPRCRPSGRCRCPRDYVEVLRTAVPAALAAAGADPADVVGIGTDFTACTMVPTTADGTPLCELPEFAGEPHAYVKLWKHHAAQRAGRPDQRARPRSAASRGCPATAGSSRRSGSSPRACRCWRRRPRSTRRCAHWVEAADWIVWQLTGTYVRNACTAGYKGIHQDGGYPSAEFCAALNPGFARFVARQARPPARAASATARAGCPRRPRRGPGCRRASRWRSATSTRTSPSPPRTPSSPACSSRSWARPPATS